jgi:preprotein translocase subunit SecY
MKTFFENLKFIFTDEVLRKRVLFIFLAFLIFRLFASIPLPMANLDTLKSLFEDSGLLGMINLFSGGGLSSLSIVMLGVMPYITASIIMQLLTIVFPKLKEIQQEGGESGRKKIANYSRLLSIPLAAIQAIGFLALLESQKVITELSVADKAFGVTIAVAGSIFLMWLGELITEFGIGNGLSLIIFAGIVSSLPGTTRSLYETILADTTLIPMYIGILASFILMIYAIVYVTEAERPVVVHQAKAARAGSKAQAIKSSIPIKLNQAGVIPIIFAVSLISFPQMIFQFLQKMDGIELSP